MQTAPLPNPAISVSDRPTTRPPRSLHRPFRPTLATPAASAFTGSTRTGSTRTGPTLAGLALALLSLAILPASAAATPSEPAPSMAPSSEARSSEARSAETRSAETPVETVSIDSLRRGDTGYGLSVFEDQEIVRFGVEVLGTWQSNTPGMSFLLTRLSGQDLERSGVLGGMSGSPVYFDDKLVGAVAFTFTFSMDPIAGITPIHAMRELGDLALDAVPGGVPVATRGASAGASVGVGTEPGTVAPVPSLEQLAAGTVDPGLLDRYLDLLEPANPFGEGRPTATWTATGFGDSARRALASRLGPLLPTLSGMSVDAPAPVASGAGSGSGTSSERAAASLDPGAAVALVMMQGDLSLAAHGTVTERQGNRIIAFGHPVYGLGPVRMPMAESTVITSVPMVSSSFKLSNAGRLIGVFDEDREAGAHGVLGEEPELVPLKIRLRGVASRDFHMELADLSLFRPTLIAMGAMGTLSSSSWSTGPQSLRMEARFEIEGHEPLVSRRSFDGLQAANEMIVHLLGIAAFLEFNELGPAPISGLELDLEQTAEPRGTTLLEARADRTEVAPGDRLRVSLDLQPFHGDLIREAIEVEIPKDLDQGTYYLMIGDGASMDAARLAVNKPQNQTLEQNLAALRSFGDNRVLEVVGLVAARGRSLPGSVMPDLPSSVRSLVGSAGTALELRITGTERFDLGRPIDGLVRIDLEIRNPVH